MWINWSFSSAQYGPESLGQGNQTLGFSASAGCLWTSHWLCRPGTQNWSPAIKEAQGGWCWWEQNKLSPLDHRLWCCCDRRCCFRINSVCVQWVKSSGMAFLTLSCRDKSLHKCPPFPGSPFIYLLPFQTPGFASLCQTCAAALGAGCLYWPRTQQLPNHSYRDNQPFPCVLNVHLPGHNC